MMVPGPSHQGSNRAVRSQPPEQPRESTTSSFYESGYSVSNFRPGTSQEPRSSTSERPPGPSQQVSYRGVRPQEQPRQSSSYNSQPGPSNSVFRPSRVSVTQNRLAGARLGQIPDQENARSNLTRPPSSKRHKRNPLEDISNAIDKIQERANEENRNKEGKVAASLVEVFVDKHPEMAMRVLMDVTKLIASYDAIVD